MNLLIEYGVCFGYYFNKNVREFRKMPETT